MIGTMTSARAELLRMRKWPAVWVILGVWALLAVVFGYVFNYASYRTGNTGFSNRGANTQQLLAEVLPANVPSMMLQGMPLFGAALMMVLGAMVAGNGYVWGTWKTVFTQGPSKTSTVAGALGALTVFVAGAVLATLVLDIGASLLIAAIESADVVRPDTGALLRSLGGGFLILQMWAVAGFGLGTLTRSPTLSVGLGLVWALVVENLLRGVANLLGPIDAFVHALPGTAAGSLVGSQTGVSASGDTTPGVLNNLTGAQSAGALVAYAVALPLLTLLLVRRRDVS